MIGLSFQQPEAMILALPLVYWFLRHVERRDLWRWLALACAVLLLGFPRLKLPREGMDVFVVADRSRSLSDEGLEKQREIIELVSRQLGAADRLGVVSFKDKSYLEQPAANPSGFTDFASPHSPDGSELAEGLALALNQVQDDRPASIYVLSDGEATGLDPVRQAQQARQLEVPIHYRNLKRADLFNLAVREVRVPEKILAREPYRVGFTVQATEATPGRYRLWRDGRIVGEENENGWRSYDFGAGRNDISFTDVTERVGIHSYQLEVETVGGRGEALTRDNTAQRYVQVLGERSLLLVNETGTPDNVSGILSAAGLSHQIVSIRNLRMEAAQLEGYKGLILNGVPVIDLAWQQQEALVRFVTQQGGGLLVCGGRRSYANGGYYKSKLESVLPVSLEDRQQSKKVSTAFSIVLDRSGSMAMTVPSGRTKMDMANHAAAECVRLMSAVDSISVIAVDSSAHIIVPQQPVEAPEAIVHQVLGIESMGGGIFTYTGLAAAGDQVLRSQHINRHILLFADAADAEEPGEYKELLQQYTEAGMTVSVVGLGTENDTDADFLKDVALRGEGEVYFTQDPEQLVQFFTADTITFTRNSFSEEAVALQVLPGAFAISPRQQWQDFTSSHYNLCFARPEAEVALMTADEDRAPVLSFWQRGIGRVAALTLDAEGPFAGSAQYGDIMLGACRWMMGSDVEDSMQIKVDYQGRYATISMEISDEERESLGMAGLEVFTPEGETLRQPINWIGHNRLATQVRLDEQGMYQGVIRAGGKTWKTGPISLPVSPEFMHGSSPGAGRRMLAQLAATSGGREVLDVGQLFEARRRAWRERSLVGPLLIALLVLLLLEVAEPRLRLLARMHRAWGWLAGLVRRRKTKPVSVGAQTAEDSAPAPDSLSSVTARARRRKRKSGEAPSVQTNETNKEAKEPATPKQAETPAKTGDSDEMSFLGSSKRAASERLKRRE